MVRSLTMQGLLVCMVYLLAVASCHDFIYSPLHAPNASGNSNTLSLNCCLSSIDLHKRSVVVDDPVYIPLGSKQESILPSSNIIRNIERE